VAYVYFGSQYNPISGVTMKKPVYFYLHLLLVVVHFISHSSAKYVFYAFN